MTTRQVQNLLQYLGFYSAAVDGLPGALTTAAVLAFQGAFGGLDPDGTPGPATQKALRHAVAYGMPAENVGSDGSGWEKIRYWTREEFRCQCGGKYCGGFPAEPDSLLVQLVDDLRAKAGAPGYRSSGLRCKVWNELQGGVSNSRHLFGKALDFRIEGLTGQQLLTLAKEDPRTRYAYIIDNGPYVHVDVD